MNEQILDATVRTETGKGAARRARRAGLVPGVIYAKGIENTLVDVPAHDLFLIVRHNLNAIVQLNFDGDKHLALVKAIQRHPVSREILHADFMAVRAGEKVNVEVAVNIIGEVIAGGQSQQEAFTVEVSVPATSIPDAIDVDITGKAIGTIVTAGDIDLPSGVELVTDPSHDLVSITEIVENVIEDTSAEAASEGDGAAAAE